MPVFDGLHHRGLRWSTRYRTSRRRRRRRRKRSNGSSRRRCNGSVYHGVIIPSGYTTECAWPVAKSTACGWCLRQTGRQAQDFHCPGLFIGVVRVEPVDLPIRCEHMKVPYKGIGLFRD